MQEVRHIGIVVSDLERALRFYRDLLGLKVARVMEESGEYIDNLLELEGVRVTTVKMAAETGPTLIELLAFRSHRQDDAPKRELYTVGPSHMAFTVKDLDAVCRRLGEAGVRFTSGPQRSPDGYARVTFCRDPDGTPIELVEVQG
jgi:catechol 2,3-dioxygenase-like lactoylglutathione lyase family enzyme